jgi:hypothetical protein
MNRLPSKTYRATRAAVMLAGLAMFMGLAGLAGCASGPVPKQVVLTYESLPEGAQIFEGGQLLGVAPVTRTFKNESNQATVRTPEVTAVWPSGAKQTFFTVLPAGADNVATIERPKAAPGLQADLDHAQKFAGTKGQESQREKDLRAREIARASEKCKIQQATGKGVINDC